ncbi:protein of unknown function DUF81 [Ferroglobus placidus DSM 10642]|uniref:Probable membrane transporter protein n=1 Tax=Ferroglobus placidus (strain DSM 10642 / AEDII12DO) TaxID=589924 RepID=D3S0V6_FERPA|nr:sulfite exporter TauE/SafE family protein [Ferroglobus placidus]ADC66347.1 protein of unknown function DUF81 [Ferroglobus placidus DSM 10642]
MEFALIGFVVGLLVGLTGIGGGALMTPVLLFLGIPIEKAIGTDLLYSFSVKSFSSALYKKGRSVDGTLIKLTSPSGILGVFFGYLLLKAGVVDRKVLTTILGATLFSVALLMILSSARRRFKTECLICERYCERFEEGNGKKAIIAVIAFLVGILVELTSIGSGTLLTFAIISVTNLKPNKIVGSDLITSLFLTGVASALHADLGNIDFVLASHLIPSGILGAAIGYQLSKKCSPEMLKSAISACVAVAALTVIFGKM